MDLLPEFEVARRRVRGLRSELSARNHVRAASYAHDRTYGSEPAVVYREEDGEHGNFFPAAWRCIVRNEGWRARLEKSYTASGRIVRGWERERGELECATSSDALLMNLFCTPGVLGSARLRALLGVETGLHPEFGWWARVPLRDGYDDRTEIDMRLGDLLVEAKLCEGDFQMGRAELMLRYEGFDDVFDVALLQKTRGMFRSYQLLRGVMAAVEHEARFCLMCDARRPDLIEDWFAVLRAVRLSDVRCRLQVVTWQEIAQCVPVALRRFLAEKYGIGEDSKIEGDDSYT